MKSFAAMVSPVLCVAKFLPGVDGVMPPLGGAEGVSVTAFFALDTVGSLLWSGFYTGWVISSPMKWMLQFVGLSILGPPSVSRLGFRSVSMPAGGD